MFDIQLDFDIKGWNNKLFKTAEKVCKNGRERILKAGSNWLKRFFSLKRVCFHPMGVALDLRIAFILYTLYASI